MSTITFDTLKFAKQLESAGVPVAQAEANARAVADALAFGGHELATKSDIKELRSEIAAMELRLTVKLGTFMVAAVGATAALVKLL